MQSAELPNVVVHELVTTCLCTVYGRTGTNVLCRACTKPMAGVKQTLHLAITILPQRCKSYVRWNLLAIFLKTTLQLHASKNKLSGNDIFYHSSQHFTGHVISTS